MPLLTLVVKEGYQLDFSYSDPLYDQLQTIGPQDRLGLFLSSRGGRSEVPWKVVSLIREYCRELVVLVPYRAHSAATHIAVGGNRLIMGPRSELGPVDPTRGHPLAPTDAEGNPIPISVQDFKSCLNFLYEYHEGKYPPETFADVFMELCRHVNPLLLGAIEESYKLSRRITRKVLETHMDREKDQQRISTIVDMLADQYHSHVYPIGRAEARNDLGLNVQFADADLVALMDELLNHYNGTFGAEYRDSQGGRLLVENTAAVETRGRRMLQRHVFEIVKKDGMESERPVAAFWCSPPEQEADSASRAGG